MEEKILEEIKRLIDKILIQQLEMDKKINNLKEKIDNHIGKIHESCPHEI